ncbi:MAG: hypothetical protein JZU63_10965, partial [Rhodoferax sp.]|nr:hypothetical protein [Rhodoferax sp.]
AVSCINGDSWTGAPLPERSIFFVNWASIDSDSLILRRDNERGQNLESLTAQLRLAHRQIVLVVDESHLHLDGQQADLVVKHIIVPDLLIEVSATHKGKKWDAMVVVEREEVIEAGLIRKQVVINPGSPVTAKESKGGIELVLAPDVAYGYDGTSENLLDGALTKQAELTRLYKSVGSPIVPLILVQMPPRGLSTGTLEHFERYLLTKHGLSRGNGVAVWLADDKTLDLDDIASNSSAVRVLFFKQAIATGWDCPRAQILVGLREMQSDTFTTQVLGRILRQPEHKAYIEESLNYGYVFTNYEHLNVDADTAAWLGKVTISLKSPFSMSVPNWFESERSALRRLKISFILAALARDDKPQVTHVGPVSASLLAEAVIADIDLAVSMDGTNVIDLDVVALSQKFDQFKSELVANTEAQNDGRKYIDKALRTAAAECLGLQGLDGLSEILQLETILNIANKPKFEAWIRASIAAEPVPVNSGRVLEQRATWDAPTTRFLDISEPYAAAFPKCMYKPMLSGQFEAKSTIEGPFATFLESNPNVTAWLKNGDQGRENFAVKYTHDGVERLFFVDFIVIWADGTIGLYDTKGSAGEASTGNLPSTYTKAEALASYVADACADGAKLEGGIVIEQHGQWFTHSGRGYAGTKSAPAWVRHEPELATMFS